MARKSQLHIRRIAGTVLKIFVILIILFSVVPYLLPLGGSEVVPTAQLVKGEGEFVNIDGVSTFVQDLGDKSAPAIILIHGFGGSTYSWRYNIFPLAASGYRVIALDLKGFGISDKSWNQDYSHNAQAEFISAAMRDLGVNKATLVGHSMGGNVVSYFAQKYPEKVAKLVLISPALVTEQTSSTASVVLAYPPAVRWGQLLIRNLVTPERLSDTLRTAYFEPEFVAGSLDAYTAPIYMPEWELSLLGVIRDSARNNLPQSLSTLQMPVTLIWGEQDTWIPISAADRITTALPQAKLFKINRAGHLVMEEKSAEVNEILVNLRN